MIRPLCLASLMFGLVFAPTAFAKDQRGSVAEANGNLDALIVRHASAHNLPEALVRRVIKRESGGNPRVISKGNYGLMQIRLGTARAMGYSGSASGLLDADTNMTYAVKYLAGAYRAAGGNADQAVRYYAAGYYYAAKRKGLLPMGTANPLGAFAAAAGKTAATQTADASIKADAGGAADATMPVADAREQDGASQPYVDRLTVF